MYQASCELQSDSNFLGLPRNVLVNYINALNRIHLFCQQYLTVRHGTLSQIEAFLKKTHKVGWEYQYDQTSKGNDHKSVITWPIG